MNTFEEMMKSYEDSQNVKKSSTTKKYDLKNYFSTYIPDEMKEGEKRIRIVNTSGKPQFWDTMWGHKIKIGKDWKTFPCLKHEKGEACPFCEAREALLATGKESDKELAKKYSAKKMYIVRLVERGNEAEGVKFWRFNYSWTKDGTLDKIMKAIGAVNHDVTDPETGRDLIVNIARNQFDVPVVQSINYPLDSTKLSEDPAQVEEWLADNRTWRDVYSTRDYDYLSIVVAGHTPVYDKAQEKFVAKELQEAGVNKQAPKDDFDSELTMGAQATATPQPNTAPQAEAPAPQVPAAGTTTPEAPVQPSAPSAAVEEDEDDDLPF